MVSLFGTTTSAVRFLDSHAATGSSGTVVPGMPVVPGTVSPVDGGASPVVGGISVVGGIVLVSGAVSLVVVVDVVVVDVVVVVAWRGVADAASATAHTDSNTTAVTIPATRHPARGAATTTT